MPTLPDNPPVADPIVSAADMQLQVDGHMVDWADFWAQFDADYEVQPGLRTNPPAAPTAGGLL